MSAPPMGGFYLADQRYQEDVPVAAIREHPRNYNEGDVEAIDESLAEHGMVGAVLVQESTGYIVAGNHTYRAAVARGAETIPAFWLDVGDDEAERLMVVLNQAARLSTFNPAKLLALLQPMHESSRGLAGTAFNLQRMDELALLLGAPPTPAGGDSAGSGAEATRKLADRFLVPPFSVLDARQGYWQERKRSWLALGIASAEGRPANLLKFSGTVLDAQRPARPNRSKPSDSGNDPQFYWKKTLAERQAGRVLTTEEFLADWYEGPDAYTEGTSVFDPVLCEIAYRWFCPPDGSVLDPFAGGSVRGIVAAKVGLRYCGVDLSAAQIAANEEQAERLGVKPHWHQGNATGIKPSWPWKGERFDLLFSCPPYYDLERYSDDPADLSNLATYPEFLAEYRTAIKRASARLANDRFACFVVGEIRDSRGICRGFVRDTIAAFEEAGLRLYNEAVLVTAVGSLALRAARIFAPGRKLARAHQSVLVFVKGDPAKAAEACGLLDIPDPAELFGHPLPAEPAANGHADPATVNATLTPGEPDGPSPAWAKGLPLDRLRAVAALWRQHDGDLPLGAFTRVKENTVAEWATDGRLHVWGVGGSPVAAASWRTAERPLRQTDFRDQVIATVQPGELLIDRVAGDVSILAAELARHRAPIWLWAWQENPADRWLADALGLTWNGTKIRASSELLGLWGPRPSETQMRDIDLCGLVRLDARFDPDALAAEIAAAGPAWADHYASYNRGHSWSAVALRGYGGDPMFIQKPAEMSRKWKQDNPEKLAWEITDTPAYDLLPGVRELIDSMPGVKHRVRLMRLTPGGGELTRHSDITDPDCGTEPGQLLRLHFPVVTNPAVLFRSWTLGGDIQSCWMAEGTAWYLDTRKPHTARNGGTTDRIHIVADIESCPQLLALALETAPTEQPDLTWETPQIAGWLPWPLG